MRARYTVKKPCVTDKKFRIMRDVVFEPHDNNVPLDPKTGQRRKREQKPVQDASLGSLNERLLSGKIEYGHALLQIQRVIIPRLKAGDVDVQSKAFADTMFCADNYTLFSEFFEKEYEDSDEDIKNSTIDNARFELLRALKEVEPLPLQSVAKKALKLKWRGVIEDNEWGANQTRKYGTRINQLLKFAGRDFTLVLPKKKKPDDIWHLSYEEFFDVLVPTIKDRETLLLAKVLFGMGLRYGEAFALDESTEISRDRLVFITRQLTRKLKLEDLKNDRKHNALVLPECVAAFREWCALPNKKELRVSLQKKIKRYSQRAFPNRPKKHISSHGLRHSYAIYMLGVVGMSISDVAYLIGDSEQVVRDHYVGNKVTDPHAKRLSAMVDMVSQRKLAAAIDLA